MGYLVCNKTAKTSLIPVNYTTAMLSIQGDGYIASSLHLSKATLYTVVDFLKKKKCFPKKLLANTHYIPSYISSFLCP